ncbi:MAG: DUF4199 domain-containing protein [Acidobacteriota bacterium]
MRVEIKWGLIFSIVSLIWVAGEYLIGLHDRYIANHAILTNLFFFPAVLMMYLAIREKRQALGGRIGFIEALLSGIGVSVIVALLSPAVQYIFSKWINPGFFEKMIEYAVSTGKLPLELARQHFNLKQYMLMSSMGAIGAGGMTSLVLAWLMRTRNTN